MVCEMNGEKGYMKRDISRTYVNRNMMNKARNNVSTCKFPNALLFFFFFFFFFCGMGTYLVAITEA